MSNQAIDARKRLILPLDVSSINEAQRLIDELRDFVGMFKIGLELYSACGPAVLDLATKDKLPIFFDGKFCDIPNTVYGACRAIAAHDVAMLNVHATGGSKMIRAASDACDMAARESGLARPILLAVTVLTSLDQNWLANELGVTRSMEGQVCHLAKLAQENGADGVVASANEVKLIRKTCGANFVIVTPGIRPQWAAANDQSRIVTPSGAIADGADYLVIGRPITHAENRIDAAKRVVEEMNQALVSIR
jgi:orotidine-5'-phosphate decarboxylase